MINLNSRASGVAPNASAANARARVIGDTRGSVAIIFALAVPVLFGMVACVTDYALAFRHKQVLQKAVDAAAIAATKALGLAGANSTSAESVVQLIAATYVKENAKHARSAGELEIKSVYRTVPTEVEVTATQALKPFFGNILGVSVTHVAARATARVMGAPNICVLGLDTSEDGTVQLDQQSLLRGKNCSVFNNSSSTQSLKSNDGALLTASSICTHGGAQGGGNNFSPNPLQDCPSFADPLLGRPEPSVGACVSGSSPSAPFNVYQSQTLSPGVYCGGLTISGSAVITLQPGVYVIKDGPLTVANTATLTGVGVGFFFTGPGATMMFDTGTTITLDAPTTGSMAGILMFEARTQDTTGEHTILSNDARKLNGTIYLSRKVLGLNASSPIADQSAYTAIVVRRLHLYGKSIVVLNTDYALTTVPVPEGIKGAGQPAQLVK